MATTLINTIELQGGKLTMNIGLNYGSVHPEATLRGTAMAANRALDVIVPALTSRGFDAFTINETTGFWQGKPEKSLEVVHYGADLDAWQAAAAVIREELHQEAVLVSYDPDSKASLIVPA